MKFLRLLMTGIVTVEMCCHNYFREITYIMERLIFSRNTPPRHIIYIHLCFRLVPETVKQLREKVQKDSNAPQRRQRH